MAEFKMPKFVYKDKPVSLDECYRNLSEMSYKSPVEVIRQELETKMEGDIYEAIQHYGISVDKEELIKALKYDRGQYEKGFIDGRKGEYAHIQAEVAREIFEEIEKIINEPFAVGFNLLAPLKQALNEYNNGIRKDLLYFIAELKKKYTEEKT